MMPLYGFLEGDTIGLLILASEDQTVASLAEALQTSARIRVAPKSSVKLIHQGRVLDPAMTLRRAGVQPLDRFDVVDGTSRASSERVPHQEER
jgi:hypothetical protein